MPEDIDVLIGYYDRKIENIKDQISRASKNLADARKSRDILITQKRALLKTIEE